MTEQSENQAVNTEPVQYDDVIEYYQEVIADLHAKLAVARAQIRNRDRALRSYQTGAAAVAERSGG